MPIQASLPQIIVPAAPATEVALAQLARAAVGLVQAAGQPVPAQVLGTLAGGLTQLQIGEMVLAVRLSAPLPAGMTVTLSIGTSNKGQPILQVTPVPTPTVAAPTSPAQAGKSAPASPQTSQQTAPPVGATERSVGGNLATTVASPPAVGPVTPRTPAAPANAPAVAVANAAAPTASVAVAPATPLDIQELARGTPRAPVPSAGTGTGPATSASAIPAANMPAAGAALAAMSGPVTPAVAPATTPVAGAVVGSAPAVAVGDGTVPVAGAGAQRPAVGAIETPAPTTIRPPATPGVAVPVAGARVEAPQLPTLPGAPPAGIATTSMNGAAAPTAARGLPQAPVLATGATPAAPPQVSSAGAPATGTVAIPYRAVPPAPKQAPATAAPLAQILSDPAQAAARQNSIVPLLARLAALGPQLEALPPPAAQAVLRLLAMRLDAGRIDGKALQGAVATAGVLARPGAGTTPTTATLKSTLLQLRSGIAGMPGAAIEAVTAIAGRPHPPVRGDEARTVRAELPLPIGEDEPARGLLGQTDAALSRLKLLQHASQPQEARPGAAPQQELRVEVPLLIGTQTALLQLVVDKEARRRDKPGERGWRMRFAFASQQTGEVGAEVALFGPGVSVSLWAENADMEAAMAEGLDDLRAALAAEGLEAGSIRMRRRAAAPSQRPGALMDSAR